MNNNFVRKLLCIAVLGFSITGCEQPGSQPDVVELQTELEQLENQVGKLEFRIFELEQALDTRSSTPPEVSKQATEPPAAQGRYDLTPVE